MGTKSAIRHGMKNGKWVFIPSPPWDQPTNNDFYSFRACSIYLSLCFKTTSENVQFCLKNNLRPPDTLIRSKQIEAWIDGARTAIGQWSPVIVAHSP
jgi:hypothetical protein